MYYPREAEGLVNVEVGGQGAGLEKHSPDYNGRAGPAHKLPVQCVQ